ncbi:alpha/beta fold hydrolase [Flavobacterium sp. ZB4P13]|uniref:alpha/beta fold hydrolase n=1 Tax=Flavobacterium sp. ZB4P13 TaxID=3401728 RepID=UPI003AAE2F8D
MKQIFTLLTFLLTTFFVNGQTIYSKSYGNTKDKPIIFIHGGPSGNATLFESTTAQKLADKGFYVIVYDRRGEGRSIDSTAKFTYNEAFDDLITIYKTYNIEKANLIGHSFGGLVATLFTEKYPQKVDALILAGALVSQQETYDHILNSVRGIYLTKGDSINLKRINGIENGDKYSAEYRKTCFEVAGENGYFTMPNPTNKANKLHASYEASDFYKTNIRNKNAPILFYKNEKLNNIDTKPILGKLKSNNLRIYAIYGKQDGIFSASQIDYIKNLAGKKNFNQIDNCSHYLFVDQQKEFVNSIAKWVNQ